MEKSMSDEFIPFRKLTEAERSLIMALIRKSNNVYLPRNWETSLLVKSMNDGGMGSMQLFFSETSTERTFGAEASSIEFEDADGIKVIASLYLDKLQTPMEIDVWKTNFSPIIRMPKEH